MIISDLHTHSRHSFDGRDSAEKLCARARGLGIKYYAVTDHYENSGPDSGKGDLYNPHWIESSVKETREQQGKHGGLCVLSGVELGQYIHNSARAAGVVKMYDFDVVLTSLHSLRDGLDFFYVDYHAADPVPIYRAYLEELIETVRTADFDVLAHMTYPLRYIIHRDGYEIDMSVFDAMHDEVLSTLARRGKALEINTKDYRRERPFTLPDENIVRRFNELGGKYVTTGSDSHTDEYIGSGVREGQDIARRAGFECVTVFQKRQPILISN